MAKRPIATQAEISRSVKAVKAAGMPVVRVEVEGARIIIYAMGEAGQETKYERWKRENGSR